MDVSTTVQFAEPDNAKPSSLLVVTDGTVSTHPLPPSTVLVVGRDATCDVRVDDPALSREHLRVTVQPGGQLTIEDLGSQNGTFIGEDRLDPSTPHPLKTRQIARAGATLLLAQSGTASPRPRRVSSHAYFEARLQDACETAQARTAAFAILKVTVVSGANELAVQQVLTGVLRNRDVVAAFAPGVYELLLLDTSAKRVEKLCEHIVDYLSDRKVTCRVGRAFYPADGRTPDALIAAAGASRRGANAGTNELVIQSEVMRNMHRVIQRIARGRISVMLLGETGVGKEVFARRVHEESKRHDGPFVALNCCELSESLLESELFGHVKGAFTGATADKPGLLETARGGTVFFDELGEMPMAVQAKLLRVIEQRRARRVGGTTPYEIDVRFVSATNVEIEGAVKKKLFREDLYFRLNGITLVIPPLRERPEEILPLAELLLRRACEVNDLGAVTVSERAVELMENYAWPGNIRELANAMERAALLCFGGLIEPEHLPLDKMRAGWHSPPARDQSARMPLDESGLPDPEAVMRARITEALERCGGNQTKAAKLLGVDRRTLTNWLNKYKLR